MLGFVMIGCQGEFSAVRPDSKDVENCLESNGEYDFTDNKCYCGGSKCPSGNSCIDDNPDEDIVNFVCAECKDGDTKCKDETQEVQCKNNRWNNEEPKHCGDLGCNISTGNCIECKKGDKKCNENTLNILNTCGEDFRWKEEKCKAGCNSKTNACYECIDGDTKCDGNNLLSCVDKKWDIENSINCNLGCNSDTGTCFECSSTNEGKLICLTNKNTDNTNMEQSGHIYKCQGQHYVLEQTCNFGCSKDTNICNECGNLNTKCTENGNDAVILTCKDGFWPEVENWNGNESEYIKSYEDRICHPSKPLAVECLSNRCVPKDEWSNLACEDYKAIIIAYIEQLDGLKKSLEQINDWFMFKFDYTSNPDNTYSICNFSGTKLDDNCEFDEFDDCKNYTSAGTPKNDINPLPVLETDISNKELNEKYNCMRYEYNCVPPNTMSECIEFINKYMCEFENYYNNEELSEFKGLFKIKPNEKDPGGAIISCNSNTYKWDVNNITPCLSPEYTYVDSGSNGLPEYNVKLTLKACAEPLEGAKYSTACAQR